MNRIAQHRILVSGDSLEACSDQVRRFFDLTSLVIYDCIEVRPEQSLAADTPGFTRALVLTDKNSRLPSRWRIGTLGARSTISASGYCE